MTAEAPSVRCSMSMTPPSTQPAVPASDTAPGVDLGRLVGIDVDTALRLTMGKTAFLERVLRIFVESQQDFPVRFAAAQTDPHDRDSAERIAHSLKGSAASIGAQALSDAALALEQACRHHAAADIREHVLATAKLELSRVLDGIADALEGAVAATEKVGADGTAPIPRNGE